MRARSTRFFLLMLILGVFECSHGEDIALFYDRNRKYTPNATEEVVTFDAQEKEGSDKMIRRRGMLMIHEDAPATVIIAHGFMATSYDALTFRPALFAGYNTLAFDFRAHGSLTENQICTLGKNEAYDVIGAVKFVKSHPRLKNKPIVLYGFSMGAMAILQAHAADPQLFSPDAPHAPVVAGIYDCPGRSSDDIIEKGLDNIKFSIFGYEFGLPCKDLIKRCAYHWPVQQILKFLFRCLASMDATQICTELEPFYPVQSAKYVSTPSLFITCKNDEKVPVGATKDVYDNVKAYKRLWISNGRRHFDSFFYNPEKYTYKVRKFIDDVLNDRIKNKKQQKILTDPKLLHHSTLGVSA